MKALLKLTACLLVAILSLMVAGITVQLLKLPPAAAPAHGAPGTEMLLVGLAYCVLAAGLIPLARGLAGAQAVRAGSLTGFLLLALVVNTMIEAWLFTTTVQSSGAAAAVMFLVPSVFIGWAIGVGFGSDEYSGSDEEPRFSIRAGRSMLAWLGWPFIYLLFGMCVAPIVTPYYHSIPWLQIPPLGTIVGAQLVRSIFFLASSLPLIALWSGSRRQLWLALGLAHFVTVGGFGLIASTFLPAVLRVTHSVEIACDSFAYAGLLVLLFGARPRALAQSSDSMEQPPALAQ